MCPLYEYECSRCGATMDRVFKMAHKPREIVCELCNGEATACVSIGGIQGEEPSWLDEEVRGVLQSDEQLRKNPITCRSEYNKYLKDNDIVPIS